MFYTLINKYLNSLGFADITPYQYEELIHTLRDSTKAQAIKYLREVTSTTHSFIIAGEYDIKNHFQDFLEIANNNEFKVVKILGLKEARDIVTILELNPCHCLPVL